MILHDVRFAIESRPLSPGKLMLAYTNVDRHSGVSLNELVEEETKLTMAVAAAEGNTVTLSGCAHAGVRRIDVTCV